MPDKYSSMTALYADPLNVEGITYGSDVLEAPRMDSAGGRVKQPIIPRAANVVLAIHGLRDRGRKRAKSPWPPPAIIPRRLPALADCYGVHDLWIFEGLLERRQWPTYMSLLSTTMIQLHWGLVRHARRCISLHGFSDAEANGKNQIGGRDTELKSILLEELTVAGIPAHIGTDPALDGSDPANICNKTTSGAGVQLEMGTYYRASLFAPRCNTRELRKNNTNAAFCNLVVALRKAMSRVS